MEFFYMISFMLMEQSDVKIHMIHSLADDKIPFARILLFHMYSGTFPDRNSDLFCGILPEQKRILSISRNSGCGMTLFLLISYVYPNGAASETGSWQYWRWCVISVIRFCIKLIHLPIFSPSMHVFNATASCIALHQNERCRKK